MTGCLRSLCLLVAVTGYAAETPNPDSAGAPTAPPSFRERGRLTGDWAGWRPKLEDQGIGFDFEPTHFYQGLISGDGDHGFEFGGRLDAWVNFDSAKLGLWEGGGLHTHTEYRYSELAPALGGALLPTSIGMKLPQSARDEQLALTSLHLSQQFGDSTSVRLGRFSTLDLLAAHPFLGGGGRQRFMHAAFAAPPSGITPAVIVGAIANVRKPPFTWTVMLYDPNDRSTHYALDDLFEDGLNVSLGANWNGLVAGRRTGVTASGVYSTKDSIDLSDVLLPAELQSGRTDGSWHVSVQFDHFLYEHSERPGTGWGLFLKAGVSDGNPNPFQSSIIGGFGGNGLFPQRTADKFGIGYFYYNFSDELQSTVNPLIEFHDEHGMELFYSFAITPWFHVTADLQVIDPAIGANDTAVIGGLRASIRF